MTQKSIFWLAPLHGITYHYMRNILFSHVVFFDLAIAPFVPALTSDKLNVKKWTDLNPANNRLVPIIPQLMGNDPDAILETVRALNEQFGYNHVNWNIGCPMNQIVRKKRGCGIMPYPDLVETIVQNVMQKTNVAFSIKMRLGLDSSAEGAEIITRMNHYPLDSIIIHPRLGIQQYEGSVDLNALASIIHKTEHKIVYSGDILDLKGFKNLQLQFPQINNWMLGRGSLRDPFLVEELQKGVVLSDDDKKIRFIAYYRDLEQSLFHLKTEQAALPKLKELWKYFAHFFHLDQQQLLHLLRITDIKEFKILTNSILNS